MRVWFLLTLVLQSHYIYDRTLRYTTDLPAPIDNIETSNNYMTTVREYYRHNRGVDYRALHSLYTTKQIKDKKVAATEHKF
jgi:hypothetical protein